MIGRGAAQTEKGEKRARRRRAKACMTRPGKRSTANAGIKPRSAVLEADDLPLSQTRRCWCQDKFYVYRTSPPHQSERRLIRQVKRLSLYWASHPKRYCSSLLLQIERNVTKRFGDRLIERGEKRGRKRRETACVTRPGNISTAKFGIESRSTALEADDIPLSQRGGARARISSMFTRHPHHTKVNSA